MRAVFLTVICLGLVQVCLPQSQPALIKVKVDAPELDRRMLLEKLNSHGKDHGMKFDLADSGFDYRIAFGTGQGNADALVAGSGGSYNTSAATADVFDASGKELFRFDRKNRWTDSGAANAAAKEIIKRLVRLRSEPSK